MARRRARVAIARSFLASSGAPLAALRRMQHEVDAAAEECLAVAAAEFFDDPNLRSVLMVSKTTYVVGLQMVEAQLRIQAVQRLLELSGAP